jgi:hypothetical protein
MLSEAISRGHVEQIPVMKPHPLAPRRSGTGIRKPDRFILWIHRASVAAGGRKLTWRI